MLINIRGKETEVEYIRVQRLARAVNFFALVNNQWVFFRKLRDKRIPTYDQLDWPNPQHKYGWSHPYRLEGEKAK